MIIHLVSLVVLFAPLTLSQVSLGRFVYNHHGLGGEVIVLNERQYMIKGFSYDGAGPAVWHTGMRKGTVGVYSEHAYAFRTEQNSCNRLTRRYNNENIVITIPENLRLSRDIETIAVFCYRFCHNFGHVKVPRNLKVPRAPKNLRRNGACKPNYPACSKDSSRDNGVCSDRQGNERTCPINNGRNTALVPALPPPNRFQGRGRGASSGRKINTSGGGVSIGRFVSYSNGVVGEVMLLNDKQFRIRGFSYNGARGKSTYFLLMERGTVGIYNVKGFASPDERGMCNGLRSYRNEDVTFSVPDGISLNDIGAIAVYDHSRCNNFGHVRIPGNISLGRGKRTGRNVCLPYFRPCSRRETNNNGVCQSRRGGETTC